jgi:hypothetical protein
MESKTAHIDLEKANGPLRKPQFSPNSQSTWESQNETLNSPNAEPIVIEEDTDEESGKFKTAGLIRQFG